MTVCTYTILGGGFKYFLFSFLFGKIPILTHIFQMGFNHQLAILFNLFGGGGSGSRYPGPAMENAKQLIELGFGRQQAMETTSETAVTLL